ncbi:hypothetical protein BD413DRAFT_289212 [Trametes elegans]|nr:hypothetical protein BD413DRAFT_289212 [Trametes elegans]
MSGQPGFATRVPAMQKKLQAIPLSDQACFIATYRGPNPAGLYPSSQRDLTDIQIMPQRPQNQPYPLDSRIEYLSPAPDQRTAQAPSPIFPRVAGPYTRLEPKPHSAAHAKGQITTAHRQLLGLPEVLTEDDLAFLTSCGFVSPEPLQAPLPPPPERTNTRSQSSVGDSSPLASLPVPLSASDICWTGQPRREVTLAVRNQRPQAHRGYVRPRDQENHPLRAAKSMPVQGRGHELRAMLREGARAGNDSSQEQAAFDPFLSDSFVSPPPSTHLAPFSVPDPVYSGHPTAHGSYAEDARDRRVEPMDLAYLTHLRLQSSSSDHVACHPYSESPALDETLLHNAAPARNTDIWPREDVATMAMSEPPACDIEEAGREGHRRETCDPIAPTLLNQEAVGAWPSIQQHVDLFPLQLASAPVRYSGVTPEARRPPATTGVPQGMPARSSFGNEPATPRHPPRETNQSRITQPAVICGDHRIPISNYSSLAGALTFIETLD